MKLRRIAPWIIMLLGAAGAALRYFSFVFGYEPEVELFKANNYSTALAVISVAVAAAAAVYYLAGPKTSWEDAGINTKSGRAIIAAAAMLLLSAGILFTMVSILKLSFASLITGILAAVSGLAILGLSRAIPGKLNEKSQTLIVIPIFWSCLWLMLEYRSESANPERELFVYRIMAMVFAILLFYCTAGCLAKNRRVNRLFASAMGCLYFSFVTIGDMLYLSVGAFAAGKYSLLAGYVYILAMLLFSAGIMIFLSNGEKPGIPPLPDTDAA